MKKMKLNVDELCVESFAIVAETAENGTVKGHERPTTRPSCDETCDHTCQTYACACLVSIGPTYCFCEDDTIALP
ncbi:MAG TPA: hypothetical protein VFX98_15640 [Longimicrobiaceae bacterium]|nr:hypothetical protein [Longimicrobiaceae bacterium]